MFSTQSLSDTPPVSDGWVFAGLLVHSTVDFNLQIPANALTMVVILAMGWVAYRLPSSARRHRALPERQQ